MKFYEDPVYIEMCRKAEEIQKNWVIDLHDYTAPNITRLDVNRCPIHFWLPRLDQLIEMLGESVIDVIEGLSGFINRWYIGEYPYKFMEQTALAYLMETKHNKLWTGTEWVAI